MKRVSIFGLAKDTPAILEKLREAGVVHVTNLKTPEGISLESLNASIVQAGTALGMLPDAEGLPVKSSDSAEAVSSLTRLAEKRRSLRDEISQLRREAAKNAFFGDFDPQDINRLRNKGVQIKFFEANRDQLSRVPEKTVYSILSANREKTVIAAFAYKTELDIPLNELPLPEHSAPQIMRVVSQKESALQEVEDGIAAYAPAREAIKTYLAELEARLELEKVRLGMGNSDSIVFLKGFCPVPETEGLKKAAIQNSWGLLIDDPTESEEPPTLLKNPKWVNLIKPVFAIINTVPGYREFDISMWFLLFFSLFFSMLIGDAGYGLIFLAGTAILHFKLRHKIAVREPFYLMYVLSLGTLAWGAVSGNWLGIESLAHKPPFKNFIVPSLNAYSSASQVTIMNLCFIIGAVQLTIGHLLVIFRCINSLKALAQLGWISILWAVFFVARNLVLGFALPWFLMYLFIGGVVLVALFTAPQRNIIKGILLGLADLPMTTINTFADNMSYIRLFAVGMATLAVAQSFNGIGLGIGFDNPLKGFGAALVLVAGHSLNIVLAAMAVVVHGVRLNMLEFSGHVGNTWSGHEYRPLKKNSQT